MQLVRGKSQTSGHASDEYEQEYHGSNDSPKEQFP